MMPPKKFIEIEELRTFFPEISDQNNFPLTDSYGDAVTETEKLKGLKWTEVSCDFIAQSFEIVYWLSPEAFHYYFPAFIKCSQSKILETSLTIENLVGLLNISDHHAWMKWRMSRWKLFNGKQWEIIEKWLQWLKEELKNDESFVKKIETAQNIIQCGMWNKL